MNKPPARKRGPGRRGADRILDIAVDPLLITQLSSPGYERAMKELLAGRQVTLTPKGRASGTEARVPLTCRVQNPSNSVKLSNWITVLTGATAFGLAALAVAPTSLVGAALAAGAGAVFGRVALKLDDAPPSPESGHSNAAAPD